MGAPTPQATGASLRVVTTDLDTDAGAPLMSLPRDTPIGFEVNRLLAPVSVSRASVRLSSGSVSVLGNLRYDPARLRVQFDPVPGAMQSGVVYEFSARSGLLAWDGVALANTETRAFHALPSTAMPPPPPSTPTLSADVAPLLVRRCATEGCHRPPQPVMALDLSTVDAIRNTTVAVMARERMASGDPRTEYADPRWGAMNRIDPGTTPGRGAPEYSYLLYKVLGDGPIVGARMPYDAPALTRDEIALLSDWIARGAPPD